MRFLIFGALVLSNVAHATDTNRVESRCNNDVSNSGTADDLTYTHWTDTYLYSIFVEEQAGETKHCEIDGGVQSGNTSSVLHLNTGSGWSSGATIDLSHVIVQINGDDAYWLDYMKSWEVDGLSSSNTKWWGTSGGKGWCLSTDSSDTFGSTRQSSGCRSAWRFETDRTHYGYTESPVEFAYTVKINVGHSSISNEGSNDDITVRFYQSDDTLVGSRALSKAKNSEYGATILTSSAKSIDYVTITTDGGDALFLDYVKLMEFEAGDAGYTNIKKWGANGGTGWCASTDSSDADGNWADYVDECVSTVRFDI